MNRQRLVAGILPGQEIGALAEAGAIAAQRPVGTDQLQPASLDLRLGARAWRVRASFLPSARTGIDERLRELALHQIELSDAGSVLETGCVYLVELEERLKLPADLAAATNPKSSTGRLDVFTRVIGNRVAVV